MVAAVAPKKFRKGRHASENLRIDSSGVGQDFLEEPFLAQAKARELIVNDRSMAMDACVSQ